MARRARLTTWYARRAGRVIRPGSPGARALARTVRSLAEAAELAGPADFEVDRRPVGRAWVRRVTGCNLWLWYRFTEHELLLLTVTSEPPIPARPT